MIAKAVRKKWLAMDAAYRALILAGTGIGLSHCSTALLSALTEATDVWRGVHLITRVALPCVSVIVAGCAVAAAPQSLLVVGAAAFCSALAAGTVDPAWDTLRLLMLVASAVAACAAIVLLLPAAWRRVVVSLLILFHFCGIFCAVMAAPPPGTNPLWLTTQVWTRLFRPYLQFTYLNNAYHFYSPEPGPATLLWFRIEAVDGSDRWVKIPNRREDTKDPLLIEYYRRLSLTENAAQFAAVGAIPSEIARRRTLAGLVHGIPSPDEIALEAPAISQYRPLAPNAKRFIASYVRYVAHAYAPEGLVERVKNVKVYRVVHTVIHPGLLATGIKAGDPTLYAPFFQGAFDADGNLLNPDDPYLYWLIPVLSPRPDSRNSLGLERAAEAQNTRLDQPDRDYLKMHAGSSPWEDNQ